MDRRSDPGCEPDVRRLCRDQSGSGSAIAGYNAKIVAKAASGRLQRAASHRASPTLRLSAVLSILLPHLLRPAPLLRAGAVLSLPRAWLWAVVVTSGFQEGLTSP